MTEPLHNATQKMTDAAATGKDALRETYKEVEQMAYEAQNHAKAAAHTAQDAASNALSKAKEGLQAVEKELQPAVEDISARTQEMLSKGLHFCHETSDRARDQLRTACDATTRYVVEQPGKSILLAAAAGATIAAAFLLGRRR